MPDACEKQVSLCFLRNGEKILLYLRDDKPGIGHPNHWALLGGQIEVGESPQVALEREIQEEVGCKASNISFVCQLDVLNNPLCEDHTIFLFKGDMDHGLQDMHLTEGQDLGYFTADEFRALKFADFLRNVILENIKL